MFDQTTNYGMPTMGGYNYQGMQMGAAPQQKFNNVLTEDEIKSLIQKDKEFSLSITQDEYLRGICNHRNQTGTSDALQYDSVTGEARCAICGYKFKPIEADTSLDSIKNSVADIIDILQTIKLMYIDLPPVAAKEFFQIIPMLEKVPMLFDYAAKNMTKHEANNWAFNNRNMGAMSMFNNLQNAFCGGMMGAPVQQPMNVYAQPGAPAGMPTYGYPMQGVAPQMNANPFGYAGAANPAMAGYQPQTQNFQYQAPVAPTAPATPTVEVAPTAPAEEVTVTQAVNA